MLEEIPKVEMMPPLLVWVLDIAWELLEESVADILEETVVDLPKKKVTVIIIVSDKQSGI